MKKKRGGDVAALGGRQVAEGREMAWADAKGKSGSILVKGDRGKG